MTRLMLRTGGATSTLKQDVPQSIGQQLDPRQTDSITEQMALRKGERHLRQQK